MLSKCSWSDASLRSVSASAAVSSRNVFEILHGADTSKALHLVFERLYQSLMESHAVAAAVQLRLILLGRSQLLLFFKDRLNFRALRLQPLACLVAPSIQLRQVGIVFLEGRDTEDFLDVLLDGIEFPEQSLAGGIILEIRVHGVFRDGDASRTGATLLLSRQLGAGDPQVEPRLLAFSSSGHQT